MAGNEQEVNILDRKLSAADIKTTKDKNDGQCAPEICFFETIKVVSSLNLVARVFVSDDVHQMSESRIDKVIFPMKGTEILLRLVVSPLIIQVDGRSSK